MTRIIHFALTIGYALFFLVHVIQVALAGWNNFRAMVTGFEVMKVKEEPLVVEVAPVPMDETINIEKDSDQTEGDPVVIPES